MSDDLLVVACAEWIAAISADADGEDPGVDPRLLEAHLETCRECRSYRDEVAALRRASAVGAADAMPDLSRRVAKLNALADRRSRWWLIRALLAAVAVTILVLAVPELLGGDGHALHESRHVGAFSTAYAAALLLVAFRPARARAILPVTMVLAGALSLTAAVDVIEGHVPLVDEVRHLPELASVALVWALARPVPERRAVAPIGLGDEGRVVALADLGAAAGPSAPSSPRVAGPFSARWFVVPAAVLAVVVGVGVVAVRPTTDPGPPQLTVTAGAASPGTLGGMASVYLVVEDHGGSDTVGSATSEDAAAVTLHDTEHAEGAAYMVDVDELGVPAGGSLVLAPGGRHLMLHHLFAPLEPGDVVRLTVEFERSGPMVVEVPVRSYAELAEFESAHS